MTIQDNWALENSLQRTLKRDKPKQCNRKIKEHE